MAGRKNGTGIEKKKWLCISEYNYKRLVSCGVFGETFNDIIGRMIDDYESNI